MGAFVFGLDLGKKRDYSALCALEQWTRHIPFLGEANGYTLHALERLPQGMPYPQQVEHVRQRLLSSNTSGHATLAIDQTGVGEPVVDYFRQADLPAHVIPVEITGGMAFRWDDEKACFYVPKRVLVSTLMVLVEGRRLHMPAGLKFEATLKQELQNFTAKLTLAGNETFGAWRESDHDDLVLALAISCWVGQNTPVGWDGSLGMGMGQMASVPPGVVLTDQRQSEEGIVLWERPQSDMPGRWDEWKT